MPHGEDKGQGHYRADQIACQHDALAIETVEQHASHRTSQYSGNGARQHHAADHEPGAADLHDQAEDRNIVEVVAGLADDLPHPRVAVVAVVPQQIGEIRHPSMIDAEVHPR